MKRTASLLIAFALLGDGLLSGCSSKDAGPAEDETALHSTAPSTVDGSVSEEQAGTITESENAMTSDDVTDADLLEALKNTPVVAMIHWRGRVPFQEPMHPQFLAYPDGLVVSGDLQVPAKTLRYCQIEPEGVDQLLQDLAEAGFFEIDASSSYMVPDSSRWTMEAWKPEQSNRLTWDQVRREEWADIIKPTDAYLTFRDQWLKAREVLDQFMCSDDAEVIPERYHETIRESVRPVTRRPFRPKP